MAVDPNTGKGTVDITGAEVFSGVCLGYVVRVDDDSAWPALVHVDGIHAADEYLSVPVGQAERFVAERERMTGTGAITSVFVKGDGGTATIACGVFAQGVK